MRLFLFFSSTKYNKRTDEARKSDKNRTRFIVEYVIEIMKVIGNKIIISAKIDNVNEEQGLLKIYL